MVIKFNNQVVAVPPSYWSKDISVAIDSSKRNSAIAVGDRKCRLIDVIEMNGADDGTTKEDTLKLCHAQRLCLKQMFEGARVHYVGIEDIITVNEKGAGSGISYHMSRFKITAVFMSFISFFQDVFGVTPMLINNWTWKTTVLPSEYTTASIKKGSLAYFTAAGSKFSMYTDDATDAVCILEYMRVVNNLEDCFEITVPEVRTRAAKCGLFATTTSLPKTDVDIFKINPDMQLEDNVTVMINNKRKKYAVANVPVDYFTYEEIYRLAKGKFKELTREVLLIVTEV